MAAAGVTTVFSTVDDLYKIENTQCPYCKVAILATKAHLNDVHIRYSVCFKNEKIDQFCIPCHCVLKGAHETRSHWHCPQCKSILKRKHTLEIHLRNHGLIILHKDMLKEQTNVKKRKNEEKHESKTFQCPSCSSSFMSTATLRKHEIGKHQRSPKPVFLVDTNREIFVTTKYKSGPCTIIHMCKSYRRQVFNCEEASCREFMTMSTGQDCVHLKRLQQFRAHQPPPFLKSDSIKEMLAKGLISSAAADKCCKLKSKAKEAGAVSVYPIIFDGHGYSNNKMYFSVYTGEVHSWCFFERVRVTFDVANRHWTCLCKEPRKRMCPHIYLCMCWTFQEKPELLKTDSDLVLFPDSDKDLYSQERHQETEQMEMRHI